MTFPVLNDVKATLLNWSPKLSGAFRDLQETSVSYKLNREIPTSERWIDGRTVYLKVIDVGTLPNTTGKSLLIDDRLTQVVSMYGVAIAPTTATNDGKTISLPYVRGTAVVTLQVLIRNGESNLVVITATDMTAYTEAYVYIKYLK